MKKTETEYEEKEVEHVYCDDCGDQCTDNHETVPKHVCGGCSNGYDRGTYERLKGATKGDRSEIPWTFASGFFCVVLWPMAFLLFSFDVIFGDGEGARQDAADLVIGSLGALLWGISVTAYVVMYL